MVGKPQVILEPYTTSQLAPSPVKSSSKKVAANLLILQGGAMPMPFSSAPVWAEPSQLLIVIWPSLDSHMTIAPFLRRYPVPVYHLRYGETPGAA